MKTIYSSRTSLVSVSYGIEIHFVAHEEVNITLVTLPHIEGNAGKNRKTVNKRNMQRRHHLNQYVQATTTKSHAFTKLHKICVGESNKRIHEHVQKKTSGQLTTLQLIQITIREAQKLTNAHATTTLL